MQTQTGDKPLNGAICDKKFADLSNLKSFMHRRTSQGAGSCSPQTLVKVLFFGQKLNFSDRSQQPKMEKKIFCIFIKRKKRNSYFLAR